MLSRSRTSLKKQCNCQHVVQSGPTWCNEYRDSLKRILKTLGRKGWLVKAFHEC